MAQMNKIKFKSDIVDNQDSHYISANEINSILSGLRLLHPTLFVADVRKTTEITQSMVTNKNITTAIIPYGVTRIGDNAFDNCESLTSITIPNSVTNIGDAAFADCKALTVVTLPSSVTNIAGSAFTRCEKLERINIPTGVQVLYTNVFNNCKALKSITIPASVTSIGDNAFDGCESLTSITIPASVTSIGSSAFSNCDALDSIVLPFVGESENGTNNTHFGYIFGAAAALNNSDAVPTSLKTVVITRGAIGDDAFTYCPNLTSITICDSVTSIGDSAFWACTGLTNVELGTNVKRIGTGAFRDCSSLTSITISDNLEYLGDAAFANCNNLTYTGYGQGYYLGNNYMIFMKLKAADIAQHQLSNTTKFIHSYACEDCTNLVGFTIPKSVLGIGCGAFKNCTSLKYITYNGTQADWAKITKTYRVGLGESENWNYGMCDDAKIRCTDGDIPVFPT